MPRISQCLGVVIAMHHRDHEPAHFHAEYAGSEASIGIEPPRVLRVSLPPRVRRRVLERATIHLPELLDDWRGARAGEPLLPLPPLARDGEIRESQEVRMAKATTLRVVGPYVLEVVFSDGTARRLDLRDELQGRVFEPLRDPALFAQATLDPLFGSVEWPNGASLAPEFVADGERVPADSAAE